MCVARDHFWFFFPKIPLKQWFRRTLTVILAIPHRIPAKSCKLFFFFCYLIWFGIDVQRALQRLSHLSPTSTLATLPSFSFSSHLSPTHPCKSSERSPRNVSLYVWVWEETVSERARERERERERERQRWEWERDTRKT